VTGKSYPTTGQQHDLIRNVDVSNHLIEIGDERLAILVCHDLAAWSPRGNAAAGGIRATTWADMQAAVSAAAPTLAVQMPHTVNNARTWLAAWSTFGRLAGATLRSGTTAIRHLDQGYNAVAGPFDTHLLDGTGWGERVIDVVVGTPGDLESLRRAIPPQVHRGSCIGSRCRSDPGSRPCG
jgi:hypothetical protein